MSRYAQRYATIWNQFTRLTYTHDLLAAERRGWRRWLLHPYVGFIIQIDDPAVLDQLGEWQSALQPWFQYDPIPPEQFHISLHHVGMLRRAWWLRLPNLWQRDALPQLAERVRVALADCPAFTVQIGPLNAFSNILFAEVGGNDEALRWLRVKLRKALPLRARPPSPWPYVPHVTLGYWGDQPAAPIREALRPFRDIKPIPLRVRLIEFTIYTLDATPNRRDLFRTAQEEIIANYHLKDDPERD
ncbi:MAG: 2'-5' RNA ligase family protein [Anaerolineae bacterium]|nr:2'-5' RNA ligase family protein [Anaerolineae bacterium]